MSEDKIKFPIHYDWPPLVEFKNVPLVIRVRDITITLLAWAILISLLKTVILLIVDWVRYPFGKLTSTIPPDLEVIWIELLIFVYVVFGLICWISYYGILRRKDLSDKHTNRDQPLALPIESEASLYSLPVETINGWRKSKLLTLNYQFENSPEPQFVEVLD